ncbi:unnamed protein product [Somion occarium]|uniref:Uncharacterized protein n=1 Tax=Somion occarium TaxID=3059160 RepID=A0ABP1DKS8_9APHY
MCGKLHRRRNDVSNAIIRKHIWMYMYISLPIATGGIPLRHGVCGPIGNTSKAGSLPGRATELVHNAGVSYISSFWTKRDVHSLCVSILYSHSCSTSLNTHTPANVFRPRCSRFSSYGGYWSVVKRPAGAFTNCTSY